MTLTRDDIKLMASERLTDDPDGGGYMTSTTIQDGVENNLFPDISEIDRAQGAVDWRKAYVFLGVNNQDTYYGSNVILDGLAVDTAVTALVTASASISELRSDLIAALNAAGEDAIFYGMKALTGAGAVNDRSVQLATLRERLIPPASAATPVAGAVATFQNNARAARFPRSSATESVSSFTAGGALWVWVRKPAQANGAHIAHIDPTHDLFFVRQGGREYLVVWHESYTGVPVARPDAIEYIGPGFYRVDATSFGPVPYSYFDPASGKRTEETHTFTTGGGASRVYSLADLPAPASETVTWTDGTNTYVLENRGDTLFFENAHATASVDRAAGLIVVNFITLPSNGSDVKVGYVKSADLAAIAAPTWAASQATLTLTGGWEVAMIEIVLDGTTRFELDLADNLIYRVDVNTAGPVPMVERGPSFGSYDPGTGTLTLVGAGNGTTLAFRGVQRNALAAGLTGTAVTATLPTLIEPTTLHITGKTSTDTPFDISPDADGYFTGTAAGRYIREDGTLSLTFGSAVKYASLAYAGGQVSSSSVSEDIAGVNPANFPADGRVLVVRSGMVAVVHNTQTTSATTVSNGSVVNCGRTRIADARVFGSDGIEIRTGFTVSKTAGTVTFTDVSGYHNPVTVVHRVEDLSVILSASETGLVTLSKPLTHVFPSGTSYLSTALQLGDMQARSHPGFQMATWTGTWADDLAGSGGTAILADYNEATHPVIVQNQGAIEERWVIIFTNVTAFKVIGEQVGQIAIGDTATNCSPINPATGQPYFTIEAAGWGSGWAIGNCYRFNTDGGSAPFWTIRSIAPSDPFESQDHITVAARGSINA